MSNFYVEENSSKKSYENDFIKGFMIRNQSLMVGNQFNKHKHAVMDEQNQVIGIIDLSFEAQSEIVVTDLFPSTAHILPSSTGEAMVIHNGSQVFIELVPSKQGHNIMSVNKDTGVNDIQKIIDFYNLLLSNGYIQETDLVLVVFQGVDIAGVKRYFDRSNRKFNGTVVSFSLKGVREWENDEVIRHAEISCAECQDRISIAEKHKAESERRAKETEDRIAFLEAEMAKLKDKNG